MKIIRPNLLFPSNRLSFYIAGIISTVKLYFAMVVLAPRLIRDG